MWRADEDTFKPGTGTYVGCLPGRDVRVDLPPFAGVFGTFLDFPRLLLAWMSIHLQIISSWWGKALNILSWYSFQLLVSQKSSFFNLHSSSSFGIRVFPKNKIPSAFFLDTSSHTPIYLSNCLSNILEIFWHVDHTLISGHCALISNKYF